MPRPSEGGPIDVLAWEVIDLDHDARVQERCLVAKRYPARARGGEEYALGLLVRNPKAESPAWGTIRISPTLHPTVVAPEIWGFEFYQAPPSDQQIGKFLADRQWASDVRPHEAYGLRGGVSGVHLFRPRVTDGGVCRSAWEQVLGRDPNPKLFPDLPAEPAAPKE